MKFFSVLTKRTYLDDQGAEQSVWYKAGYIKETPHGGKFLMMYHQPDTTFYILPQEENEKVIQLETT